MDSQLLELALSKARELLGDRASAYEPILQRIQALQDGSTVDDTANLSFDYGVLQAKRGEFLVDIEVTNILMSVINIYSLEFRSNGPVLEIEQASFMDQLRQLYPTRMEFDLNGR